MKGFILTREVKDGTKPDGTPRAAKRYDACWRVDGKQKSKTFPRRKQAERFLTSVVGKVQDGTYVEIKPVTFKTFAEAWLTGLGDLKPSTRAGYASLVTRRLIPAFGDRSLTALTVEDVNGWLGASAEQLRPKTLRNALALLHKLLADAKEGHYLAVNRLSGSRALRRPRALRATDETEIEILTPAEVHRLLDALAPAYAPLFLTAVSTGVRLGELLALQWGDLDEAGHRLSVRRTAYRGTFYVPKTKRSRRTIDLGDQLLAVLSRVRRDRYAETLPPPDALIFPSVLGGADRPGQPPASGVGAGPGEGEATARPHPLTPPHVRQHADRPRREREVHLEPARARLGDDHAGPLRAPLPRREAERRHPVRGAAGRGRAI